MKQELLGRDEFRRAVFERDHHVCVMCKAPAQDAHHIIERRLFPDGGYYLDNGASVCGDCHILCEETNITVEKLRERIGITTPVLPPHFYRDEVYDKWGNPVLPNGMRLRGELFDDLSVRKILSEGGVLGLFTDWVKYPRTYHLPWSPGLSKDDRVQTDLSTLKLSSIVVTVKMDGENTTMYGDHIHARSVSSGNHESRDRVKALWGRIAHDIPDGWRICGENLFAQHSIAYKGLPSVFLVFSIWDHTNTCLSWDSTVEWAELLGLRMVPVLYQGPWDQKAIEGCWRGTYEGNPQEGYVVRTRQGFHYKDFRTHVAKFVRENHIQTHGHWMRNAVVPNEVIEDGN